MLPVCPAGGLAGGFDPEIGRAVSGDMVKTESALTIGPGREPVLRRLKGHAWRPAHPAHLQA